MIHATPWGANVRFPCPPVCTARWTADDWDRWILNHGAVAREVTIEEAQRALDEHPDPKPSLAVAAVRSARLYAADGDLDEASKLTRLAVGLLGQETEVRCADIPRGKEK